MKKEDLKKKYTALDERQKAVKQEAADIVRDLLKERGPEGISLVNNPAYILVEGCDYWLEDSIYGVRLRNDAIEVSLDTLCNEEMEDIPDWNESSCRTEFDHYSDINWLSLLDSIIYALED